MDDFNRGDIGGAEMSGLELDTLIARCKAGNGDKYDAMMLADELVIYRDMALRLERVVHDLIKLDEVE